MAWRRLFVGSSSGVALSARTDEYVAPLSCCGAHYPSSATLQIPLRPLCLHSQSLRILRPSRACILVPFGSSVAHVGLRRVFVSPFVVSVTLLDLLFPSESALIGKFLYDLWGSTVHFIYVLFSLTSSFLSNNDDFNFRECSSWLINFKLVNFIFISTKKSLHIQIQCILNTTKSLRFICSCVLCILFALFKFNNC